MRLSIFSPSVIRQISTLYVSIARVLRGLQHASCRVRRAQSFVWFHSFRTVSGVRSNDESYDLKSLIFSRVKVSSTAPSTCVEIRAYVRSKTNTLNVYGKQKTSDKNPFCSSTFIFTKRIPPFDLLIRRYLGDWLNYDEHTVPLCGNNMFVMHAQTSDW